MSKKLKVFVVVMVCLMATIITASVMRDVWEVKPVPIALTIPMSAEGRSTWIDKNLNVSGDLLLTNDVSPQFIWITSSTKAWIFPADAEGSFYWYVTIKDPWDEAYPGVWHDGKRY